MNYKSFVKLSLIIVATAVIIGNTNIFAKSSFAETIKSFHGGSTNSFAQACDAFKCITKEDHGKPGSPSSAIAASCFDFLDINLCDTTPSSKSN